MNPNRLIRIVASDRLGRDDADGYGYGPPYYVGTCRASTLHLVMPYIEDGQRQAMLKNLARGQVLTSCSVKLAGVHRAFYLAYESRDSVLNTLELGLGDILI